MWFASNHTTSGQQHNLIVVYSCCLRYGSMTEDDGELVFIAATTHGKHANCTNNIYIVIDLRMSLYLNKYMLQPTPLDSQQASSPNTRCIPVQHHGQRPGGLGGRTLQHGTRGLGAVSVCSFPAVRTLNPQPIYHEPSGQYALNKCFQQFIYINKCFQLFICLTMPYKYIDMRMSF